MLGISTGPFLLVVSAAHILLWVRGIYWWHSLMLLRILIGLFFSDTVCQKCWCRLSEAYRLIHFLVEYSSCWHCRIDRPCYDLALAVFSCNFSRTLWCWKVRCIFFVTAWSSFMHVFARPFFFYIQRVFHWNNDLVLRFCFLLSKIELPPPPHLWIVAFAYVGIIQLPDGDIYLLSFFWSWCITNICWTSNQLHRAVWFPHFDLNWSVAFSTQHLIWKGVLTWFSFIYWPPVVLEWFFCLWKLRRKDRQAYLCSIGRMGMVILTTS